MNGVLTWTAVGVLFVGFNVLATRRLWASPQFEVWQKVVQSVLFWVLPGTALITWNALRSAGAGGIRIHKRPRTAFDRSDLDLSDFDFGHSSDGHCDASSDGDCGDGGHEH